MAKAHTPWRMPLAVMGKPTGDKRMFEPHALDHLALPLPFRDVAEDVGGHQQAHVVGRIDKIDYAEKDGQPIGQGVFFDGDTAPEGIRKRAEEALFRAQQGVAGPSVDLDSSTSEQRVIRDKQTLAQAAEALACGCGSKPEEHPVNVVTQGRMRAATLVPIAAFAEMAGQGQYGADLNTGGDPNINSNAAETTAFSVEDFVSIYEAADQAGLLAAADEVPGWEGSIGPSPEQYHLPHVYARDVHSGAGNCVCGRAPDEERHVQVGDEYAQRKPRFVAVEDYEQEGAWYAIDPNVGGGVDREKLEDRDFIDPKGRRFPIVTPKDVQDAVSSYGRAKPLIPLPEFKRRLTQIAHRKGQDFVDALPASWDSLTAAAAPSVLDAPPDEWFQNPKLTGPTPLTITDDGRVFGHLATWGTCHTGIGDACITAPKSRTNYAYFHTGELVTASGKRIPVGRLTYGGGHAKHHLGYAATAEHYDQTSAVGAYVRGGEDEHGIWVAGAMSPTATSSAYSTMRAAPLSGDWRRVAGNLELVAALHVNTAGFPIPRAMSAAGEPQSLTSAGALVTHIEATPGMLPADELTRVVRQTVAQLREQERAEQDQALLAAAEAERLEGATVDAMVELRVSLLDAEQEAARQAQEGLVAALAAIGEE